MLLQGLFQLSNLFSESFLGLSFRFNFLVELCRLPGQRFQFLSFGENVRQFFPAAAQKDTLVRNDVAVFGDNRLSAAVSVETGTSRGQVVGNKDMSQECMGDIFKTRFHRHMLQ